MSSQRSRARERERETDRKGSTDTYLCGFVQAEREGPKIKREKSIVEEKRGDVFRPNYVPPLALHAVAVAAAATALQGARPGSAQLTKGADTNDSNPRMFRGGGGRGETILVRNVGRTMAEI